MVLDLEKILAISKKHQLISVVDNTFLTPVLQQPAKFGADHTFD